jgi:hypothetical protein
MYAWWWPVRSKHVVWYNEKRRRIVTVDGLWIGYWIYWPLIHATANLHTSLATASNSGDSSTSREDVLPVQRIFFNWTLSIINSTIASSLLRLPCRARFYCQASTELRLATQELHCRISTDSNSSVVFFITLRRGPRRKHLSSVFACVFVSAGTSLSSRCSETVAVAQQWIHMLQYLRSCTKTARSGIT